MNHSVAVAEANLICDALTVDFCINSVQSIFTWQIELLSPNCYFTSDLQETLLFLASHLPACPSCLKPRFPFTFGPMYVLYNWCLKEAFLQSNT